MDRRGFLFSPWAQGSLLLAVVALGASLQVYSTHRLRAHEVVLRRKHEAALSNLQQAAGHCDAAGGVQNLNAVADFIRSEIDDHFKLHNPDDDSQASWFSRGAAGLLMIGVLALFYGFAYHMDKLPGGLQLWLQQWLSKEHERPATTSKLIAYHLELWFSDNSFSKVLSLLYLTLALVWIGGLGIFAVTGESLYDAFWQAIHGVGIDWTFAGEAVEYGGFLVRVTAVLVSLGGMLVTALMLGLVSGTIGSKIEDWKKGRAEVLESGHTLILGWSDKMLSMIEQFCLANEKAIGNKIEDLKKGRTEVLESGHTLILGWSDKMLNMIDQLCLANESAGGKAIVILAERDKQDMEYDIHKQIHNLRGSRVLCRSGNPLLAMDLARVSVDMARAIVVLATAESPERSDARVLRIVLSLMGVHDRLKKAGIEGGLMGHIVAEVCDLDNEPLVKMVGCEHVQTVVSHDIIGRLMIQCARQHGLAAVWQNIMGFEGDEFYMREWPELVGRSFQEILTIFEDAVPLGIRTPEGNHLLNPEDSFVIHEGDQIIVIAEDDDTYRPMKEPAAMPLPGDTCPPGLSRRAPERILFCGWRRDMHDMIAVLDAFVYPGSELWLYNEVPVKEREKLLKKEGLDPTRLTNLTLVYKVQEVEGELVSRKRLEELAPEQFSSILILADESATFSTADVDQASADSDSRNLATLLLLRDLQSKRMGSEAALSKVESADGRYRPMVLRRQSTIKRDNRIMWYDSMQNAIKQTIIISEILDTRTRHLIQELEVSEFVLSNELVSMALAMVAENPEVNDILSELFTPDGNELYVHPASRYLREGEVKSFFEIMVRAREKEEILVGLKYKGHKSPQLNPKSKAEQVLSLKTVSSLVVILTGVDPDKPSRRASWVGEVPSTSTSSVGDLSSIEKGINSLAWAP